jgi:hypothetical protein
MGGSFPPHDDPELDGARWYWGPEHNAETHPGLLEFLAHSDCDGEIAPDVCLRVADDLEALLPKIEELDDGDLHGGVSFRRTATDEISVTRHPGHIARDGGYVAVTRRFIEGCRRAAAAGEVLGFY